MSRGMSKRKNYKNWKEPQYGYSEMSVRTNQGDYGTHLRKRPTDRYYSEYSYSALENHHTGRQDTYRPRYEKYQYSVYDSLYDSEDDDTYRYSSKSKYTFDDTEYSSYYDEYDTDYTDISDKRRGNKYGDSKYLYRYEELNPGSRHVHSDYKNKKHTSSNNNHRSRTNDLNVYALNDILGETGFTYDKHNKAKRPKTLDKFSETDSESDHLKKMKGSMRPEYDIYSTQINRNASAFDKKRKSFSPEKLLSVTDYQEYPMLAFKKNTSNGESDFIYLPIVMKEKGKKPIYKTGVKTYLTVHNSSESAEKPLEDTVNKYRPNSSKKHNSFNYKKNREYEQDIFKANKPNIKVYAVSGGPSQVFRNSAAKSKSFKKSKSNTSMNEITSKTSIKPGKQRSGSESMIIQATNTAPSNEIINMAFPEHGVNMIAPSGDPMSPNVLKGKSYASTSAIEKQSFATNDPRDTDKEETFHSIARQSYVPPSFNEKKSMAGQQSYLNGFQVSTNQSAPLKSIIKPAPKKSTMRQSYTNQQGISSNPQYQEDYYSDLESEGQELRGNRSVQSIAVPKSVAGKSSIMPKSQTSIVQKKSSITEQVMPKSLLRQTPKKSFAGQSSVSPSQLEIFAEREKMLGLEQYARTSKAGKSGVFKTGQSLVNEDQKKMQSPTRHNGAVMRNQSVVDRENFEETQGQNNNKNILRQSSIAERSQSFVDGNIIDNTKKQSMVKSLARQSGVAKNSSYTDVDQGLGTGGRSIIKSMGRKSGVAKEQSYLDVDQALETGGRITRKSMGRQSGVSPIGHSFMDNDEIMETERQNTMKSLAKKSSVASRGQSLVSTDKKIESKEQNTVNSLARQSGVAPGGQSSDVDKTRGTKRQSTVKSLARQISAVSRVQSFVGRDKKSEIKGQSTVKSAARQSSIVPRDKSSVDRLGDISETKGQITVKSVARQSSVVPRGKSSVGRPVDILETEGQSTVKSIARQSSVAPGGKSSVGRPVDVLETEGQSTVKSIARQSSVAPGGKSSVGRPADILETEGQSTMKSVARQSAVALSGQSLERNLLSKPRSTIKSVTGRSSAVQGKSTFVEQQRFEENVEDKIGTITSIDRQRPSAVRQQDTARLSETKQSVTSKQPTKSKSKTVLKRLGTLSRIGKFSKKHGQSDQDSSSTTPMIDNIISEEINQTEIQRPISKTTEVSTEEGSATIKPTKSSTVTKKSTKSRFSRPFKSLLSKSRKSDAKLKRYSNIEDVQPTEQYFGENPRCSGESSDQNAEIDTTLTSFDMFDNTDAEEISSEGSKKDETPDNVQKEFSPIVKGYDISPMLHFIQIVQFVVGVTIYDKLMEVLAVL